MHPKELDRGEVIALAGAALLVVALFQHWYHLGNANTTLGPCHGPNTGCTGWQSLPVVRYLLLVAAAAPVILAWIILRGHALSWPRGEVTALTALAVLALALFFGPIDHPGNPRSEVSLQFGWWMALGAGVLILIGSIWRTRETATRRKPPGVL